MYFGCCYTTAILQWSITINLILKRASFIYPRRNNSRRTPARTLSISGLESRNWQFWLKIMMKSGLDFPFWNLTSPNWFGRRSKELFLKKNERFFKILMSKSLAISVSFLWFINPKRDWISKKQNQVSSKSTNHVEYETGLDLIIQFPNGMINFRSLWYAMRCTELPLNGQASTAFACFEYFRRVQNCNLLTLLFFLVSYTPLHTHILCKFGWLMVRETVQTVSGCPKSNYVSCHEK